MIIIGINEEEEEEEKKLQLQFLQHWYYTKIVENLN